MAGCQHRVERAGQPAHPRYQPQHEDAEGEPVHAEEAHLVVHRRGGRLPVQHAGRPAGDRHQPGDDGYHAEHGHRDAQRADADAVTAAPGR